jgi:glutathione S-transferase
MIKVWGRVNSVNVQKVLWALAELDLAYERIDAGLEFGVVDSPAYRTMNPNALVPTMDDDGFVLWESNVIVRYLATKYGMGTLCPAELRQRFTAECWMDWQQTALNPPISSVFVNLIRLPPEERDLSAAAQNCELAERSLAILDERLAARFYLVGDSFSMADIPAGASVSRWRKLPIERRRHPHVERWLARLGERPGFRAHVDLPLS